VSPAAAQTADPQPGDPPSRRAVIEQAQAEKSKSLHPYVPGKAEHYLNFAERYLTTGLRVHPYFESAYSGGGFTLGAGYNHHVSSYNTVDVRGSITFSGYKRFETEFVAPRLLRQQLHLSLVGGWREATLVGYYGAGMSTSADDRANYGFIQPYGSAALTLRPGRRLVLLQGQVDASRWEQTPGSAAPSVEEVYTPDTLTGLGATVTYLHAQGTIGIDSRPSPGYARRGSFVGVTFHDFDDPEGVYGFTRVDYEAIQHVPLLRDAWVLSFHGLVSTAAEKDGQQIPFCRRWAAAPRCVRSRAGASGTATACSCRPNGGSSSTAFSIRRCSSTPAR
jgi:hypothetical protein